ncbi:hypothetical protein TorRG33x02_180370 [Trema orientale]|uniref:Uncharacterized protein n=1 Tax=Trema orientale TaxID=63057 RepID=A0A2P5EKT4_TREOI|nr:hypothetical protein TorRG33x02_180370 [Trema orientale]
MGGLLSSLVLSTGELEPSTKYFEGEMTPSSTTCSCYGTPCSNRFSSFEYNNAAAATTGDLRTKSFWRPRKVFVPRYSRNSMAIWIEAPTLRSIHEIFTRNMLSWLLCLPFSSSFCLKLGTPLVEVKVI